MLTKKIALLGGIGLSALLAFGGLFTFIVSDGAFNTDRKLRFAMELLDEGRWDLAGRLARDLEQQGKIDPEKNAAWHYVQGVSKLLSVMEELDTPKNRRLLLAATEHLEKSDELGFPVGYQGKGKYYLGYCYFNTYHWPETIQRLEAVPMDWPAKRSDALEMMVLSELRKLPADFDAAQADIEQWQRIPGMAPEEQARLALTEARLAFAKNDLTKCEEYLTEVPKSLPQYFEAQIWRGRWRLEQLSHTDRNNAQRERWLVESEKIFRDIIQAANTQNTLRRQATYLLGRVLRSRGDTNEALGTLNGVRQRNPSSAEAIAAGIEEAEILLEQGNLDDVVSSTHHILRNIEDLSLYNEFWLPLEELRTRLLDVGRQLRERKQYEKVIDFASYVALAFPLSHSARLQAETYERWGRDLAARAPANTLEERSKQRQEIQEKFLLAGDKYQELARLELRSTEYPDILWSAIECYQLGNDLDDANKILAEYLRFEDRTKRPRGLLALGRNRMHTGEWQRALDPLNRCLIEYPTNPVSYEARLLAAKANSELDDMEQAIELLTENLSDFDLHPNSPVWQDSLFELGQTLFRFGDQLVLEVDMNQEPDWNVRKVKLEKSLSDFEVAIARLGEAVSRYPEDPRYYDSRYMVAKSYRLAAKVPEQMAKLDPGIIESSRRQYMQERRELLENAMQEFREIHQTITSSADLAAPGDSNVAILRNCYFGEADALYDLGRWDEAIQAYRNAASRFLNQPESLEALVQMAECHRKMGREFETKKTLVQAEQVLRRIPPEYDSHFVAYTRTDRQGWDDLITWLRTWD